MKIKNRLVQRFADFAYRHAYIDSFVDSAIATQIKALREQRSLNQTQLAELAGMKQSQISGLEDVNNTSWKVRTLKRLAKAFDLVLVVRFESFGEVLPRIEDFSRSSLERPSFSDDPAFSPSLSAGTDVDTSQVFSVTYVSDTPTLTVKTSTVTMSGIGLGKDLAA